MNDVEQRIRDALAEVDREDTAPGFHQLWSRAEDEARNRAGKRRVLRLVLVPAMAAAAVLLFFALAPGSAPDVSGTGSAISVPGGLETLVVPELASLPSDDLAQDAVKAEDVDRELLLAWNEKLLGSRTDWLLTLDIPVWDREEERKMP